MLALMTKEMVAGGCNGASNPLTGISDLKFPSHAPLSPVRGM